VLSVEVIEQMVSGPMKDRLLAYLVAPAQAFYVLHIAGSWFLTDGSVRDQR
jgi:hypothetical protein